MSADTLVVTPTLGTRPSLEKTLETVRRIGGQRVQHIITCPPRAVDELQRKYPALNIVAEKSKGGIYAAINAIIEQHLSGFEYFAYINDDDYWLPGYVELFKALDSDPQLDAAYGRVLFEFEDGRTRPVAHTGRYKDFPALVAESIIPFTQQSVLIRSKVIGDIGIFDTSYKLIADTDFWIRSIQRNHSYKSVSAFCAGYSQHLGQLSSNKDLQKNEHDRLAVERGLHRNWPSRVAKLRFRLANTPSYIKRFIQGSP